MGGWVSEWYVCDCVRKDGRGRRKRGAMDVLCVGDVIVCKEDRGPCKRGATSADAE